MISDKKVTNHQLLIAIIEANKTLSNPEFYKEIRKMQFDQTTSTSDHIADNLQSFHKIINVDINQYRSTYFYRFVNAYINSGDYRNIYINMYHRRNIKSYYETIIHEYVHLSDVYDENGSYGHGDNNPTGDETAAPNAIGRMALKFIAESPSTTIKPKTKVRRSFWWYLNPRNWF